MKFFFFFVGLLCLSFPLRADYSDRGHCERFGKVGMALDINEQNWIPDFESDFNVPNIGSLKNWYPGLHSDFGGAVIYGRDFDSQNFKIQDGSLIINLFKNNSRLYGGIVQSLNKSGDGYYFSEGYAEARMRLPATKGTWTAFWLLSKDGFLKDNVLRSEIDVLEAYGQDDGTAHHSSIHIWPSSNSRYRKDLLVQDCITRGHASMFDAKFHLFGVMLDRDFISIYYDRNLIKRFPRLPEFQQPYYILLNLTTQGEYDGGSEAPSYLAVDYVKVWRRR